MSQKRRWEESDRTEVEREDESSVRRRPRVAVIAFACSPGSGSEPGVGWEWATAISSFADTTVFTRFDASTASALRSVEVQEGQLRVVRIKTPFDSTAGSAGITYLRYAFWVVALSFHLRRECTSAKFDVVHHVTYASDWLPSVFIGRDSSIPLIWGPVGGATQVPWPLFKYLNQRGRLKARLRGLIGKILRRTIALHTIRSAKCCLALNDDTYVELLRCGARKVEVRPNAVVPSAIAAKPSQITRGFSKTSKSNSPKPTVVMSGRILDWKGHRIALLAAREAAGAWRLSIYGNGPYRRQLEAEFRDVISAGIAQFHGVVPRDEFLNILRSQTLLLIHPSLHDSSPWVVAEAASLGVSVAAFPIGGATILSGSLGHEISVDDPITSLNVIIRRLQARFGDETVIEERIDWSKDGLIDYLRELYAREIGLAIGSSGG